MASTRILIPEYGFGQARVKFDSAYHIARADDLPALASPCLGKDPLAAAPSGGPMPPDGWWAVILVLPAGI
jgi:hypothetical protein